MFKLNIDTTIKGFRTVGLIEQYGTVFKE